MSAFDHLSLGDAFVTLGSLEKRREHRGTLTNVEERAYNSLLDRIAELAGGAESRSLDARQAALNARR
jgi:hypothetical protein